MAREFECKLEFQSCDQGSCRCVVHVDKDDFPLLVIATLAAPLARQPGVKGRWKKLVYEAFKADVLSRGGRLTVNPESN